MRSAIHIRQKEEAENETKITITSSDFSDASQRGSKVSEFR
jgi:hypothetical protein